MTEQDKLVARGDGHLQEDPVGNLILKIAEENFKPGREQIVAKLAMVILAKKLGEAV